MVVNKLLFLEMWRFCEVYDEFYWGGSYLKMATVRVALSSATHLALTVPSGPVTKRQLPDAKSREAVNP